MSTQAHEQMQRDWDQRAREDAYYYVAFGRRQQPDEEFFATGWEVAQGLIRELKRLPGGNPRARRALEIGCGPGRLMRALSPYFGEIHGVDVSAEMIRLGREKLRDIRHAHFHHVPDSTLAPFADDSFDFVYSYAVFQHIPERAIVLGYFRETRRVLREGGLARFQINGLPDTGSRYDTWNGVRLTAAEIAAFAWENDFQLLALEGAGTQYMWTTWRKRPRGWARALTEARPASRARVRRVTNADRGDPLAPVRGRFAGLSLWVEELPEDCDLNSLEVRIAGRRAEATYIGAPFAGGLQQVSVRLPEGLRTGLAPVELLWLGEPLCPAVTARLIPPPPAMPRVVSIRDGVNCLLEKRIVSDVVKVLVEELRTPETTRAWLGERELGLEEVFCVNPWVPTYELNFRLPAGLPPGRYKLVLEAGGKKLELEEVEVAREAGGER